MRRVKLAMVVVLGVTSAAQAGEEPVGSRPLEEIVVTAQRREQRAQDVPIATSAFSGEQLAKLGVSEARDIAAYTPGLQWKGAYQYAAPTIFLRGIGDNTFQANNVSAVGLYFDDVYVSSGTGLNQMALDLDRVEVLKGPQGTLYGRNTTGGAVNFISRKPVVGDPLGARGSVTVGDYGAWSAELAAEIPLGEHAAARVSGGYEADDGPFKLTEIGGHGRDIDARAARAMLAIKPNEDLDVLLNVHGSRSAADAIMKFAGAVDPETFGPCAHVKIGGDCTDYAGFRGSANYLEDSAGTPSRERKVDTSGAGARLDWDAGQFVLTAITAYEENNRTHREDLDHAPTDWIQNEWLTNAHQFSQEIRVRSADASSRLRWIAGAYYGQEGLGSFQSFTLRGFGPGALTGVGTTLEGVAQDFSQDLESTALFGEVYYDLSERWTLTLGLRQTWEKKDISLDAWIFDADGTSPTVPALKSYTLANMLVPTVMQRDNPDWSDFSGRAVIEFHPSKDVLVYGSLSRGFKAGGFNGGALLDQAEATVVNPEYLTAWELGVKSELLDGRMRLNGAAFYYDFTDQQVFVLESSGASLVQTLSNAGKSSVRGAEVDWQFLPTEPLLVSLGAAWLDAEFDKFVQGSVDYAGNKLPAAPDLSVTGLVRYTWALPGHGTIALQGDASYTGDQFFEATNNPVLSQSSRTICNARLEYATEGGRYRVALWGRNLTDERYLVDGFDNGAFGWYSFVPGNPLTWGVTVSMDVE